MLPQSAQDYDLQLQRDMFDLVSLGNEDAADAVYDLCFVFCPANVPGDSQQNSLHPQRLLKDLTGYGYKCWYEDDALKLDVAQVVSTINDSKVVLLFMSNEFVADPLCQNCFRFIDGTLCKKYILVLVGTGREWSQSPIGIQLSDKVYINMQDMNLYNSRLASLHDQIQQKLSSPRHAREKCDVFISYCWVNSELAVTAGDSRRQEGALGSTDPRALKQFLEDNGITCWIDIDRVGRTGLFEDIAEGMKSCKIVVACVSDEYTKSGNCKMEFRFAHISLKKPIILAVVGTGLKWESSEIGMLSLDYPKVNCQLADSNARSELLSEVRGKLESVDAGRTLKSHKSSGDVISRLQKDKALQELCEVVQRKFLRQLSSYVDDMEPLPRLFVFDFAADNPTPLPDNPSTEAAEGEAERSTGSDDKLKMETSGEAVSDVFDEIQSRSLCLKILCEYESGWHSADDGLAVELGGYGWLGGWVAGTLWEQTAPYMARILSIISHSNMSLNLLNCAEGNRLLKSMQNMAGADSLSQVRPIYLALRNYVEQRDTQRTRGSLKRCYMPSGKYLWLCEKHQRLARVSVLPTDDPDSAPDASDSEAAAVQVTSAEAKLFETLSILSEEPATSAATAGNVKVELVASKNMVNVMKPPSSPARRSRSPSPTGLGRLSTPTLGSKPAPGRSVLSVAPGTGAGDDFPDHPHRRRSAASNRMSSPVPAKSAVVLSDDDASRQAKMNLVGLLSAGVHDEDTRIASQNCLIL